MHDWQELKWKSEFRRYSGRLMATIEPDSKYEGMFRVRLPNGQLGKHADLRHVFRDLRA